MPESTDLKAEMAACWKLVWNVDPLPFSVPERFELVLLVLPPPPGVLLVVELPLELQALTMSVPSTAVVTAAQRALLLLIVVTVSLFSLTTWCRRLMTGRGQMDGFVGAGVCSVIDRLPVCRFLWRQQPDLRTVAV